MKEYNINLNLNGAGAACIISAVVISAGLLLYYAENGYLPSYKDGRFEFIPAENKKQIIESIPAY